MRRAGCVLMMMAACGGPSTPKGPTTATSTTTTTPTTTATPTPPATAIAIPTSTPRSTVVFGEGGRAPSSLFCVTNGSLETLPGDRFSITSPKVRASLAAQTAPVVEIRFDYLGATAENAPLDDGELRRQIALKLRAQDTCNVVYVTWRIEPESKLVVSVKSNPGKRTHAECGAHGYQTIRGDRALPVPKLTVGSHHVLRAEMKEDALEVRVDGSVVWQGSLGVEALLFNGPVGLRTDNARFEIEYVVGDPTSGSRLPCGRSM